MFLPRIRTRLDGRVEELMCPFLHDVLNMVLHIIYIRVLLPGFDVQFNVKDII